jgi:NADH dehydrogenase
MMKLGQNVCVIGGAGPIGKEVIGALSRAGYHITVAVRRPERYRELALEKNVKLCPLQGFNFESFNQVFKGHSVIINLLADQSNRTETVAEDELVSVTQIIKKVIEQQSIPRLIQLSQIGANASQAKSSWLRILGECDAITHNLAQTKSTILRAGLLIGAGDQTTQLYKNHLNRAGLMMIPHAEQQIQPLWVKDFAKALVSTIKNEAFFNRKVEVAGEERMTVMDLATWVRDFSGKTSALILPMCNLNARFMLLLGPLAPFKTTSVYQQKQLACELTTQQDFASEFGFVPTSIEKALSDYVVISKVRQRYDFFRSLAGRKTQEFAQTQS